MRYLKLTIDFLFLNSKQQSNFDAPTKCNQKEKTCKATNVKYSDYYIFTIIVTPAQINEHTFVCLCQP